MARWEQRTHISKIKTDVETQEVEDAAFSAIEDVVSFVKWLDDELSYLVDERVVLKHFNWPEQKADALREAAFAYCDLKKLESEASGLIDNVRQPCSMALKKMQTLLEKLEHGVYNLTRLREFATVRFKSFHIPVDWMLETGSINQEEVESLSMQEPRLDEQIRDMQERLRESSEDENNEKWLFVTEEDIKNLPCFQKAEKQNARSSYCIQPLGYK